MVKMSIPLKVTYRSNEIPIKIPVDFVIPVVIFTEIEKKILKILYRISKTRDRQNSLEKEKQS